MEDAAESLSPTHLTDVDPIPTGTGMASSEVSTSDVSSSEEHTTRDTADLPHLVIQLIQCQHCSRPLRSPLRLPCGNSVCRECLPAPRSRTGITYPVAEGRDQEFTCFWKGNKACVGDHCVGDCGADVLLGKLVGLFGEILGSEANNVPRDWSRDHGPLLQWKFDGQKQNGSVQLQRYGWLQGIYSMALEGRFPSDACEVIYGDSTSPGGSTEVQDLIHFQTLRDSLRTELDCQVCYALVLDPMTTPCGHTFCRKCVARVLDHTDLCPICRRKIGMPNDLQSEPINQTVARLIDYFFPDQISVRRETSTQDETGPDHEKNLPLFVCTLSFPTMPTFLHVFEPRYRLMIRRVLANGDGKFGMVMYNRQSRVLPGQLDDIPFVQYGTLLMIERYELLPDGRSLVVATGVSRFKIVDSAMLDGYYVAKTERIDDISLAEEERLESMETSTDGVNALPEENESNPSLDSIPTQQLLLSAREFIANQRRSGAPWLHPRVMLAYGPIPTDAARFPWWFASILPISEEEKYPILAATSVRERLKISAKWARQLEARDW
ncbi:Zinc finger, RING-type [Penicillium expansum]|uniref:Zinc finger, RING-type n=1 Tax=Penicillium expansum TaxID=27334 RepID=A0A0A2J5Z0_PENEN|nr:Zinc finger, RING-type [Penicillium expansum]KGO50822.1 Zinc finger, RING-type [Penicillium expansum]